MSRILFILIIAVAAIFRLNQLSQIPPHPSLDEVSIGYNAYSILRTGADEYGNKLPILLRAYDDWRPALYVYLVIPFVKFFGLNVLSVRLSSAILSILTIIAVYYLVRELFNIKISNFKFQISNFQWEKSIDYTKILALTSVFLLAINPWHIYISRLGHEVNAAFSFLIFAILFFFKFVRKNSEEKNITFDFNLVISAVFFGLSFDSYQSAKIVVPLILFLLFILFYKTLLLKRKTFILSCLVGVLVILPVILETFKPYGLARFQGTNVFSSQQVVDISAKRIMLDTQEGNFIGLILDNRRLDYFHLFTRAYLSHFNIAWLFTNQGSEEFKIPSFGLFHLFELFFIVFGILFLVKKDFVDKKIKVFLFLWLLIGILPGAITTGFPHAMRIINILPVLQIIGAFGFVYLLGIFSETKNIKFKYFAAVFSIFIIIFSIFWLNHSYFTNFKRELSYQFQYGVLDSLSYAKKNEYKFDKIIVSNKNYLSQSYMFYLFLNQYDPSIYQKSGGTKTAGFNATHRIGKYEFGNINDDNLSTLYILNVDELPKEKLQIIKTIKTLDGNESLWVAIKK